MWQNLRDEGVNIRDMRTIVEVLAEFSPRIQDPLELTSRIRQALGRAIVQGLFPGNGEVQVMALDPGLERVLMQAMAGGGPEGGAIEPGLAETLLRETAAAAQRMEDIGLPPVLLVPAPLLEANSSACRPQSPVLLVPAPLRWLLSRFLRRGVPSLKVVSNSEVPETRLIRVSAMIAATP